MELDLVDFHEVVIPVINLEPMALKTENRGWYPVYPDINDRNYFLVKEVANIFLSKNIIRRKYSRNGQSEELLEVQGMQQVRKWLKIWREENPYLAKLYNNSLKYGYLISKVEFVKYFERMTGGDLFNELDYIPCFLSRKNRNFYDFKVREIDLNMKKIRIQLEREVIIGTNQRQKLETKLNKLEHDYDFYSKIWFEELEKTEPSEPRIEKIPSLYIHEVKDIKEEKRYSPWDEYSQSH